MAVPACSKQEINGDKADKRQGDIVFQNSLINALMEGLYDDDITIDQLRQYGTLGLGTFNRLDGEMVAIDSEFYRIKATKGLAYPVSGSEKTLPNKVDLEQLQAYLDRLLPSKNIIYAFRIEGNFGSIETRSVPPQKRPYPRLVEVAKNQPVFEFKNINGYLVGFWFPAYMKDINVPGYHFHFLSKDKKRGGHLLGCQILTAKIDIDQLYGFKIILPKGKEFLEMNLEGKASELEAVER
jgi:acetolactate decarboxylase